jgi:hypothetical protein
MEKVDTMAQLWQYARQTEHEEFFVRALHGKE